MEMRLNVTVAVRLLFMVTEQLAPATESHPDHPAKVELESGEAARVTIVPEA